MFDQTSDTFDEILYKIQSKYTLPDFIQPIVKNAFDKCASLDMLKLNKSDKHNARLFADKMNNQFPVHTKAATWVSAAYFFENIDKIPAVDRAYIGEELEKAGRFYGIDNELYTLAIEKSAHVKQASVHKSKPESLYAVVDQVNGKPHCRGLIETPEQLQKAADWLEKYSNSRDIPVRKRFNIASQIIKRAEALNLPLTNQDAIERMALVGYSSKEHVAEQLLERANIGKYHDKTAAALLEEFATLIYQKGLPIEKEPRIKIAEAIEEFDNRIGGTNGMVLRGELPTPENVVCSQTVYAMKKFASTHVEMQSGDVYSLNELTKLPKQNFQEEFGTDLANACYTGNNFDFTKASSVLKSLPRPMAEQFNKFAKAYDVTPTLTQKAASTFSIFD